MKRFLTLLLSIACLAPKIVTAATSVPSGPGLPDQVKAADISIPIGNTGRFVNLQELSAMRVADVERLTGRKMGWFRRLETSLALRKLRRSIRPDGTMDIKMISLLSRRDHRQNGHFQWGGFALGLLGNVYGVLVAYLIHDGSSHRRIKWAWIGLAISDGLFILILMDAVLIRGKRF
jgi:hypothetical protein